MLFRYSTDTHMTGIQINEVIALFLKNPRIVKISIGKIDRYRTDAKNVMKDIIPLVPSL